MSLEVRSVQADELVQFIDALSTGFLDRPNVEAVAGEVSQHWDLTRAWAAFDDGRICGTFRTWAGKLTVPGCRDVPASAVTGVTVLPTHRRRGVLSRMVRAGHAGARERGEIVSMLFASEFPIYGRFGYGPATTWTSWTLRTKQSSFLRAAEDPGRISILPTDESALEICHAIYEAVRLRRPGEVWRRPITWKDDFGLSADVWGQKWKGFVAVHHDASGTPDGFVRYHTEDKWDDRQPANKLFVDDLQAVTDDVEAALWRFLASIDWVATIRAERRSPDEQLPWLLTNLRATTADDIGDGLWLKLLDVPAALEARRYEQAGSVVLEVIDGDGADPYGNRIEERIRVALDAGPDGVTATATDRSPDLTIASGALGAAYLGGTRLSRAVLQAGFEEHRPGALDLADALLKTRDAPWCSSFF